MLTKEIEVKNTKGKTIRKVRKVDASWATSSKIKTKIPPPVKTSEEEKLELNMAFKPEKEVKKVISNPKLNASVVKALEKGKAPSQKKISPSKKLQSVINADFALIEDEYPKIETEKKPMEIYKEVFIRTIYPKK